MSNARAKEPTTRQSPWIPVPDPTVLTTDQLRREIQALRELLENKMAAIAGDVQHLYEISKTNHDDIEKSFTSLHAQIQHEVKTLQSLHEEKFRSIATQFAERDTREERNARDNKVAVDAALKAQQESFSEQNKSSSQAINKSEMATGKQIEQQGIQIQTSKAATDDKIDDIKERMTAYEGRMSAYEGRSKGVGDSWGVILSVIVAGAVVAAAIFAGLALRY
jgi:flagellar capping protein FliD